MRTPLHLTFALVAIAAVAGFSQSRDTAPAPDRTPAATNAERGAEARERERRDAEDRRLIDLCSAADGELRADALLAAVEAGAVKGKAARAEACRAAFAIAAEADVKVSIKSVSTLLDTTTAYLDTSLERFPVDRLSLECRAVRAMLEIDPEGAAAKLAEIPADLRIEETACAGGVLAAPARFYATLVEVVDRGFGREERARGAHLALAHRFLAGVRSPSQVAPAAAFLARVRLSADEHADLVRTYSDALAEVPGSDDAVVLTLADPEPRRALEEIASSLADRPGARSKFLSSLRAWLVRSLRKPRCKDVYEREAGRVPAGVAALNRTLLAEQPISEEEVGSKAVEPSPDVAYWTSPVSRRLFDAVAKLQHSKPATPDAAEALAFRLEFDRVLDGVRTWKSEDERSVSMFFEMRSSVLGALYVAAIDGPGRRAALSEFVGVMKHYEGRQVRRAVWLQGAALMLGMAAMRGDVERAEVLEAYASSGSRTLEVYAELERLGSRGLLRSA